MKIHFSYITAYDDDGQEIRKEETIETERHGKRGWTWTRDGENWVRTNEEGQGMWIQGKQLLGTQQFHLPDNEVKALIFLAQREVPWKHDINKRFPHKFSK